MKLYHMSIIFLIFFITVVIKTDLNIGKMEQMEQEKAVLTESLYTAVSDAIRSVSDSGRYGGNSINKKELIDTFFSSLYSSLGILSDRNKQIELELCIPVILLCDYDGFYIYYYDEYKDRYGNSDTKRIWSEKVPYYYQDEDFIYRFTLTDIIGIYDVNKRFTNAPQKLFEIDYHEVQTEELYRSYRLNHANSFLLKDEAYKLTKKTAIITQLEQILSYYTFEHNSIARQNGISYRFSFPPGQGEEWTRYMDDVNILVVFQGYPYGADGDDTFNKIASSGANILKRPVYYIEKKSWYQLAHKEDCEKLKGNTNVLEEPVDSLQECAKLGAYFDDCIKHYPRAPELK
jgi:hypothetical protein